MKTTAGALFAACLMLSTPAWSQSIPELEPYLESDDSIKGTPSGEGTYTDVIIGTGDEEVKAGRLSLSLNGPNLTDLVMEDVSWPVEVDGKRTKIRKLTIEGSSIPLDLQEKDEESLFEWLLNLNAKTLSAEGIDIVNEGVSIQIESISSRDVVDGYFQNTILKGFWMSAVGGNGVPIKVQMDEFSLDGFGAGFLIYLRQAELDGSILPARDRILSHPRFDFVDNFPLSEHQHHLRQARIFLQKLVVDVVGSQLFSLDLIDYKVSDYSGPLPIAGAGEMNGVINLETMGKISRGDPKAVQGLQAFQAVYGQPTVAFSAEMLQTWSEVEKIAKLEKFDYTFEKLARVAFKSVSGGYNPADVIAALEDPNDDFTIVSMMDNAEMSQTSIKVTDLGALDVGFTLAPPNIKRDQIALQAAQIAGIGVVQAMQMGIKLNGSIAEVLSGFISNGGTIEIRQSPGAAIPLAQFYKWLGKPDDQAAAMSLLSTLDLEVVGSQ